MISYQIVESTEPRRIHSPIKYVGLPILTKAQPGSDEHYAWTEENWWMVNYRVHEKDKPEAVELALKLDKIFQENPHDPHIPITIQRLRELYTPEDTSPLRLWRYGAYRLVEYTGCTAITIAIMKALENCTGNILEALCGHHSYFDKSEGQHIVAIDYCIESLQRFTHPECTRICCNLNQVTQGAELHFFEDASFDVISICFGYKYPEDIVSLMTEFRRILRPEGVLSFIESPSYGYQELCVRDLCLERLTNELYASGFTRITNKLLSHQRMDRTSIYHIKAQP